MSIICRTCLQSVDNASYFYIDTFDNTQIANTIPKDVLQVCVPELDLYISEQPGICVECLNMFENFFNFKNKCLASEEKINSYLKRNKIGPQCKINLTCVIYDVDQPTLNESDPPNHVEENYHVPPLLREEIVLKNFSNTDPQNTEEREVLLLSCSQCSFVTMESEKLNNHKCVALKAAPDRYRCPHCEYCSNRRYRLNYHINAKHTKANWYDCSQCEYKTTDSSSLKRHQKFVHCLGENDAATLKCCYCEFYTMSEVALQRHRASKHGPVIQYCSLCSYQTKDKSNFRKHQFVHGDKPRKCTKCDYQCVSPYQLERHYKKTHA